ncbi:MAG: hypothetical protein HQL59_05550 [Magnetococcales bacterium]|nr:hypothetical protein [Magnetococcales bacterium]
MHARIALPIAALLLLALTPGDAWAYVDPGIIAALFQAGYAAVFGLLAAWVFRPWRYLSSLFGRKKEPPQAAGNDGKADRSGPESGDGKNPDENG